MQINSEQAKQIDAYINSKEVEVGKWPIEISGHKEILPFFKLPISLLHYNTNNGRLAMEMQQWHEESGRNLDCSVSDPLGHGDRLE